jgi:outer membrane protein assembly factor BamB
LPGTQGAAAHDLYDWDLQNSPVLSTARGQAVVIDGGKAGIIELNAQTGKPIWKLPVGLHNGHDHDGLLTKNATPSSQVNLPRQFCLEPGIDGGIVTQLASNGSTTLTAVSDKQRRSVGPGPAAQYRSPPPSRRCSRPPAR